MDERYVYHEVSNEVEQYECYYDTEECCELFDNEGILNRLNQQDKRIKELEEQLANSIRPKFEIGQECYLIDDDFNYFKNTKEFNIVRSKIKKQENWYYVKDYGVCHEDELFSTKEEAEAKLKELEGM